MARLGLLVSLIVLFPAVSVAGHVVPLPGASDTEVVRVLGNLLLQIADYPCHQGLILRQG